MAPSTNLLRVNGTDIVNGDGKRIILKGVCELDETIATMKD